MRRGGSFWHTGELQLVWPILSGAYRSAYLGARAAEAFVPTPLIQVNA
jgi:hypothetical protein